MCCKVSEERAADLARYMFNFATRPLGGAGEALRLAELLLVSLIGRSVEPRRWLDCDRDLDREESVEMMERDRDLVDMTQRGSVDLLGASLSLCALLAQRWSERLISASWLLNEESGRREGGMNLNLLRERRKCVVEEGRGEEVKRWR